MQNSRPLRIFQRNRKPTQLTKAESQDTNAQPVKTEQLTPDGMKAPSKDFASLPELYSGSQSEEEVVHINFETIGSNKISPPNQQRQAQIALPSHDIIQSAAEVDKIIEQINNRKDLQKSRPKMPEKNKHIYKRRKVPEPVQFGELFIGRLKKRDRIKPKVTFKDVDEIYRCQCGKDYLSYMGIYRHIKTIHLQKDQYQLFRLHTFKDHQTGKTIKTVIIERSTNSHPEQTTKNREKQGEKLNENIVLQHPDIKEEEGNLNECNLSLNYDEAISQSRQLRQQPDVGLEPTISLSKYEKLIEDYHKILNQTYEKEKQNLERTQRLMQQNSMLYQAKEKYKLKLKLLQAKLQSYMIRLEAKDSSLQNISQNDTNPVNDNTVVQLSASSQQSRSLPQFSTFNFSNSSLYGSSIEEVFSLGLKNQQKKKSSKGSPSPQLQDVKGILFDPQIEENKARDFEKENDRKVKFEQGETEGKQSLMRSNRTSQQTPFFKGYESDTETQYGEPGNGKAFLFKSEDIASRSPSFR